MMSLLRCYNIIKIRCCYVIILRCGNVIKIGCGDVTKTPHFLRNGYVFNVTL